MTRWLAQVWIGVVIAVALGADCLAADRPLVYARGGERVWLAAVTGEGPRGDGLREQLGEGDWALWPPIARSPYEVRTVGRLAPLEAPSRAHVLGTDDRGRDVAARMVHGARVSMRAALIATVVAMVMALVLGVIAVRRGGATEVVILAVCDVLAAAPALLAVIAIGGLTGATGVAALALLVAVPRGADTTRVLVASLRSTMAEPFVDAARAAGAGPMRVLIRHALPHAGPAMAAAAAITAATTVLAEAALSYLGLGAPPPTASWGELLAQASQHDLMWWLTWPAGLVITATAAALLRVARR